MINYTLLGFLLFTFTMGILIVSATISAQNNLPDNCKKSNLNIAMNIVLMLGIMLIVIPFTQMVCHSTCKCETLENNLWYKTIYCSIFISYDC